MDKKERAALIRKGNELFNKGELEAAIKIFLKTGYKDGIIRIGDYYFYEKKQPLLAFKFYKKANMHEKVNEIFERMVYALGRWIGEDKLKQQAAEKNEPAMEVSPILKKAAEDILKKNS
ncbi:MAG: hypothetical protein JW864_03780 [Spirochaetes bacterium]|nr:hypothetical protein [Spirochaetota bacterium]